MIIYNKTPLGHYTDRDLMSIIGFSSKWNAESLIYSYISSCTIGRTFHVREIVKKKNKYKAPF